MNYKDKLIENIDRANKLKEGLVKVIREINVSVGQFQTHKKILDSEDVFINFL